jgi:hypothetical protein
MSERDVVPTVKRNVARWGALGAATGGIVGLIFGLAFATPGRFGFWMAIIAPAIFFGAVSAFTAGIASLGTPAPGDEPSDESSDRGATSFTDR